MQAPSTLGSFAFLEFWIGIGIDCGSNDAIAPLHLQPWHHPPVPFNQEGKKSCLMLILLTNEDLLKPQIK